jgi:hypothetical protein
MRRALSTPDEALAYVKEHGAVLESGRGKVPSLAEAIAGEPIRGSWWSHARSKTIFDITRALRDSPELLVCRLIGGRITFIHRRLWPALVRLADQFDHAGLAAIREEHGEAGAHELVTVPWPQWVPHEVLSEAEALTEEQARTQLATIGLP